MIRRHIDNGREFDWGRTSADYARYRDIYPPEFYRAIVDCGLCVTGQDVLDIGTGTGVLPRGLAAYGAHFTGIDVAAAQIAQAVALAEKDGSDMVFRCAAAEDCVFPDGSFDVVTACQCFTYFDHRRLAPLLTAWLKPRGKFVVLYMAWLPAEDAIARQSEELILKYNPQWTGYGETRHPIVVPEVYDRYFTAERQTVFDVRVPFDRAGWHGRIMTCRGVEASLTAEESERFAAEHSAMLAASAPAEFAVPHYVAMTVLTKKDG